MTGTAPTRPKGSLNVLIIEESAEDAELIVLELRRAGFDVRHRQVGSASEMAAALENEPWDVILYDDAMPSLSSTEALSLVRDQGLVTPVLIVSSAAVDETAVAAMKAGARDIIMKDKLWSLAPAIGRELEPLHHQSSAQSVEQKRQRSERHFRALVEHSSDAVCLISREGIILYASSSSERILLYTPEDLVGRNGFELVEPESLPTIQLRLAELIAMPTGGTVAVEARVRRKDGTAIWTESVGTNLLDELVVGAIVVNFRDITDRKQAEEALRESEESYRVVAETASDGIIKINDASEILFANPAAQDIFGYTSTELLGQPLTILMPEYLRHVHRAALKRYIDTRTRHMNWNGVELPGLHKSGAEISLEISFGEFVKDGKHVFTGVVRDITPRKRLERHLAARGATR